MNQPSVVTGNSSVHFKINKTSPEISASVVQSSHALLSFSPQDFSCALVDDRDQRLLLLVHDSWQKQSKSWSQLQEKFDDCLEALPYRIDHCAHISAIADFPKFSLVPEDLYRKGMGPELLSYTSHLQEREQIFTDHWSSPGAMLVYSLPGSWVEWFHKTFGLGNFRHQGTALQKLYQRFSQEGTFVSLHVADQRADLFIASQGQVLLYNQFPFQVEEDLLYYLLFALEQYRLLPTEVTLFLSGKSYRGEKLYLLLERYLGEVKELPLPQSPYLDKHIAPREWRQHAHLMGIL